MISVLYITKLELGNEDNIFILERNAMLIFLQFLIPTPAQPNC
jgi:hypothetical protein